MVFSYHFARDDFAALLLTLMYNSKGLFGHVGIPPMLYKSKFQSSKNAWVSLPKMNPKLFETYLGMLLFREPWPGGFVDLYTLGWISK